MGVARAGGWVLVGLGLLLVVIGAFYGFAWHETYFRADDASLPPEGRADIPVAPGAKIVIGNYRAPDCPGGRLALYDNLGAKVWERAGARAGGEEVLYASACHAGECTYHLVAECTSQEPGGAPALYTIHVYYRPPAVSKASYTMLALGLAGLTAGAYLVRKYHA